MGIQQVVIDQSQQDNARVDCARKENMPSITEETLRPQQVRPEYPASIASEGVTRHIVPDEKPALVPIDTHHPISRKTPPVSNKDIPTKYHSKQHVRKAKLLAQHRSHDAGDEAVTAQVTAASTTPASAMPNQEVVSKQVVPEAANSTRPTVLPSCAYEKPQSQFLDPETYAAENVSSEITKSEKVTTSNDKSDSGRATVKRKKPLKQRVSSAPKKCPH